MKSKIVNKQVLVAKFMGGILSTVPNLINIPQTISDANILTVKGSESLPNGTYSVHRINELDYNTSWSSIMRVQKKISEIYNEDAQRLHFENGDIFDDMQNHLFNADIYGLFETIVKFIIWYNEFIKIKND